ncbi:MAG: NAD(P)H-dependent oxidoreductase subunit E [Desulfurococcaceae archaeon]
MNQVEIGRIEHIAEIDVSKLVDSIIERHGCHRSKLIPILQDIQGELKYLPRKALELISNKLSIPISEIIAVASFYHQFRLEPIGDYIFQVCLGTACYLKGANDVYEALKLIADKTRITVEKARCFGCCSLAPVMMVINTKTGSKDIYGRLNPNDARKIASKYLAITRSKR